MVRTVAEDLAEYEIRNVVHLNARTAIRDFVLDHNLSVEERKRRAQIIVDARKKFEGQQVKTKLVGMQTEPRIGRVVYVTVVQGIPSAIVKWGARRSMQDLSLLEPTETTVAP